MLKHTVKKQITDKETNTTIWVWELSKLLVCILLAVFIIGFFFCLAGTAYSLTKLEDSTPLNTLIDTVKDILIDGLLGYMIKAMIENVLKNNWIGGTSGKTDQSEEVTNATERKVITPIATDPNPDFLNREHEE